MGEETEIECLVAKLRELGFIAGRTEVSDLEAARELLTWLKRPSPGIPVYRSRDATDDVLGERNDSGNS